MRELIEISVDKVSIALVLSLYKIQTCIYRLTALWLVLSPSIMGITLRATLSITPVDIHIKKYISDECKLLIQ